MFIRHEVSFQLTLGTAWAFANLTLMKPSAGRRD
ncbi:hypothetical protein TUN205_09529 [Pyrenophora tritici-repentis]|nr:hypothetical protein Alg215_10092 [Pyrenophora tritici-repentis]KAI0606218.1 hypothetical protein TUN205_09529 [Pyrenophora tritici-repentis]